MYKALVTDVLTVVNVLVTSFKKGALLECATAVIYNNTEYIYIVFTPEFDSTLSPTSHIFISSGVCSLHLYLTICP